MLLFSIITFLLSCGPSKSEIEAIAVRAQFVTDSINKEFQIEAQKKALMQDELLRLKARIAAEEVKLEGIKKFKLLRTIEEKAKEVEDQTLIIEELKGQIEEIEAKL